MFRKLTLTAALVTALVFAGCGGKKLVHTNAGDAGSTFTDKRDGQTYRTVVLGKNTWMAQDLNFAAHDSRCYDDDDANCAKYGRLYTWIAASKSCPDGWYMPTREDWEDLVQAAGGSIAGKNLKSRSPDWNGDDIFGFFALPGGFYNSENGFYNLGDNAGWWSSSAGNGPDDVWTPYLSTEGNVVHEESYNTYAGLSARCIKYRR